MGVGDGARPRVAKAMAHWYTNTAHRWILELTLIVGSAGLLHPRCHRRVGLKAIA